MCVIFASNISIYFIINFINGNIFRIQFYVAYNSTVFNTQTLTGYRTTYTISRYDSMGDYFIGIYANNVNYTYAIQYCPGTCSSMCHDITIINKHIAYSILNIASRNTRIWSCFF